jgi:hypothetical protein
MPTNSKKKSSTTELVIRITNAKLRKHIEDKARQTGRAPEAVVNEVFGDLEAARITIRMYMAQMETQRREHEESLRKFGERVQQQLLKQIETELKTQLEAQMQKPMQLFEAFANAARSWRHSAEKAIALCEKYAVKVGYFNTVRRQRDELLGLVERFLGGKTVRPDEVGEIYAIAHSGLIDRMIDRIEITAPPEVAPFNPDPLLFAGD